uniref:Uncharacterized protein n=1 Tax=Guillardia theta TaxID=55529 RepID=A0A7S4PRG2_GUITH|mmetsp:Transcript_9539/g.31933  ORF Transcript_9539/g.31933 Transcript_9539/m.31933 type:complete len:591 (+) Transcript_9539:207-1979(+)
MNSQILQAEYGLAQSSTSFSWSTLYNPRHDPVAQEVVGGIRPQFTSELKVFQSSLICPERDSNESRTPHREKAHGCVLFVGGSVWAMDWAPPFTDSMDGAEGFLALATMPSGHEETQIRTRDNSKSLIQVWKVFVDSQQESVIDRSYAPSLEYTFGVDCGIALALSWCPARCSRTTFRLGIFAAATSSGHILVYSVPSSSVPHDNNKFVSLHTETQGFHLTHGPLFSLLVNEGYPTCLSWSPGEAEPWVAAGTTAGSIFLLPLLPELLEKQEGGDACVEETWRQSVYEGVREAHASEAAAVTCLSWCSSGSFATGGIDGKVKLWSIENLNWPIFVQSVSKGTWVTSLVWVDGGSKRQAAQGRKSKGGSQSDEGRPAIVFTLDDGRVGTLAIKQMVQRWIFAREFTFWDSIFDEATDVLLLASSEGTMLEMPLGLLDPVHLPLPTSFLMAELAMRQNVMELRVSNAPDRLSRSLKQRFEACPQVERRIRTAARSTDADSFKTADRLGKDGQKKGNEKGKQKSPAAGKKRKQEEEDEGAIQDLKPQVEAQGEQRRLSFPPAQVALHRIRLFQGRLQAVAAAGRSGIVTCLNR